MPASRRHTVAITTPSRQEAGPESLMTLKHVLDLASKLDSHGGEFHLWFLNLEGAESMTMERGEIEDHILTYLIEVYPQSVVSRDIAKEMTMRIAVQVTEPQVRAAILSLVDKGLIVLYRSDRIQMDEVKCASQVHLVMAEQAATSVLELVETMRLKQPTPELVLFLPMLDRVLEQGQTKLDGMVKAFERRQLARLLQAFAVMTAVFGLLVAGSQFLARLPEMASPEQAFHYGVAFFSPVTLAIILILLLTRLLG